MFKIYSCKIFNMFFVLTICFCKIQTYDDDLFFLSIMHIIDVNVTFFTLIMHITDVKCVIFISIVHTTNIKSNARRFSFRPKNHTFQFCENEKTY